ncbi:unnamed protein product [Echinostoma caproni]|uniref:Sulfhydryl oxidase n=1 Tax=Echinostoma caproni TaxID=27848 RepID=A0A183B6T7_9TREM|nr:unnamed protein product [Echinostoma caproni]
MVTIHWDSFGSKSVPRYLSAVNNRFHSFSIVFAFIWDCRTLCVLEEMKPTAVLHAMNRFLPRFFSCLECAYHFALNSAPTKIPTNRAWPKTSDFVDYKPLDTLPPVPITCDDQILWLNAAHNGVNKRLERQPTEDPQAPKVEYPPRSICESCWSKTSDQWELGKTPETKAALVEFLKRHYTSGNWVLNDISPDFITPAE